MSDKPKTYPSCWIDPQPRQPLQVPPMIGSSDVADWQAPLDYAQARHQRLLADLATAEASIAALKAQNERLRADALILRDLLRESAGYPPETCDEEADMRAAREREYDIVRRIVAEIQRQDIATLQAKP
jgi:hypothetical protein